MGELIDGRFPATATVNGDIKILGANGAGSYLGLDDATVYGSISFTGSTTGPNNFIVQQLLDITGNIIYIGGSGADYFNLQPWNGIMRDIEGTVYVNLGDGDNQVSLNDASFSQPVSVLTGTGKDQVTVVSCEFASKLTAQLGAGDDTITVYGSQFNGASIAAQAGNDSLSVEATALSGGNLNGVSFDLGDGNDTASCNIDPGNEPALLNGGAGTDTTNLDLSTPYQINFEVVSP